MITEEQRATILELARDCRQNDVFENLQKFFKENSSPYCPQRFRYALRMTHTLQNPVQAIKEKDLPLIKFYIFISSIDHDSLSRYTDENVLTYAVRINYISIVKFYLKSGADLNYENSRCLTLLQVALLFDRVEIAQLILHKKYNVFLSDAMDIIKFLLDKPEEYRTSENFSTLLYFASKINVDAFELVLSVSEVDDFFAYHPYAENNLLNVLVMRGNKTILKLAVNFGVDLNFYDDPAVEPMYYAVTENPKIIPFLVKNGADLHADTAYTLFNGLIDVIRELGREENRKAVRALERSGVSIFEKLANDENEFYHLCRYADGVKSFLLQLERGVDINHVNKDNYTPLKFALEDDLFGRDYKNQPIEFLVSIITRMHQNKEFINENNIECLKDERVRNFHEKCKEELCRLKKRKITNSVVFYDFLTGDLQKLVTLARNKEMMKQFRLELNEAELPIYFQHLKRNFERAIWRLRKVEEVLKIIGPKLPPLIVETICSYLNDNELKERKSLFLKFLS